jgi:hypothetical protein
MAGRSTLLGAKMSRTERLLAPGSTLSDQCSIAPTRQRKPSNLSLKWYQKALEVDPTYWNADTAKRRIEELTKKLSESKN